MKAPQLIETLGHTAKLKTKLQNILSAYQNLDYHLLNEMLEEDYLYQDMKKTSFVLLQKRIFDSLRKKGDAKMLLSTIPSTSGCSVTSFHSWSKLGVVGDSNYSCKKCETVIQTKSWPSTSGCTQASFVSWTKL